MINCKRLGNGKLPPWDHWNLHYVWCSVRGDRENVPIRAHNNSNESWKLKLKYSSSPLLNIYVRQPQTYFDVSLMQVVRWDRSDVRQEMFFTPRSTHWLFNCARSVLKINYFHEWEGKWKDNGWIVLYYTAHCAGAWGSARRFQITVLSWQAIPTSEFDMHHNTSPSHNLNFNAS